MPTLSTLARASRSTLFPGAINPLSARLIDRMGFSGIYVSGAVLSNSVHGVPDTGLITLTDLEQFVRSIRSVTSLPILSDIDTGFGGPENAAFAVRRLEAAGVNGVHIEDQEFPKRCGHLDGKSLVPPEVMLEKLAAMLQARTSSEFMIFARSDARAVEGMEGFRRRARAYLDAGADGLFPEALTTEEEFRSVAAEFRVPLIANMTEFGKSVSLPSSALEQMGYSIIIFPVTLQRLSMKAMQSGLEEIKRNGTTVSLLSAMQTRQELYDLLNYRPQS